MPAATSHQYTSQSECGNSIFWNDPDQILLVSTLGSPRAEEEDDGALKDAILGIPNWPYRAALPSPFAASDSTGHSEKNDCSLASTQLSASIKEIQALCSS
jgi:hypothetical protein